MDTTEVFIRMCGKAKEIEKGHEFVPGDYKAYDDIVSLIESCDSDRGYYHYPHHVWLPQQDQLQEMLKTTHLTNPYNLIAFLWNILNEDKTCPEETPCEECIKESMYWRGFKTMEQLLLAFVMKEKYSKIWDGNDWIFETTC